MLIISSCLLGRLFDQGSGGGKQPVQLQPIRSSEDGGSSPSARNPGLVCVGSAVAATIRLSVEKSSKSRFLRFEIQNFEALERRREQLSDWRPARTRGQLWTREEVEICVSESRAALEEHPVLFRSPEGLWR